jgi:hypothetical protein
MNWSLKTSLEKIVLMVMQENPPAKRSAFIAGRATLAGEDWLR